MQEFEFDSKYHSKGGIKTLLDLIDHSLTLEFIGNHFGVTKANVRLWCKYMLGINYDPRPERKEQRINEMLEFAQTHTEKEFREAFFYDSKYYHDLALSEAYQKGIYKI